MRGSPCREAAVGAVRRVWPGAVRTERSPEQLLRLADDLTRAVVEGRRAPVDALFREIESPPPTLHWAPDDDFLAGSSPLRFLNRFWHDHRAAADLPPSSSIDPFALGPALGILRPPAPAQGWNDLFSRLYGTVLAAD